VIANTSGRESLPAANRSASSDFVGVIEHIVVGSGIGYPTGGVLTVRVTHDPSGGFPGEVRVYAEEGRTAFSRWSGEKRQDAGFEGLRGGQVVHVTLEPDPDAAPGSARQAAQVTVLRPN